MIYLSDTSDLDHDLSDLSVRTMWYTIIHVICLSDLSDLDHDLYDPSARHFSSRSLSTWSVFRSIRSVSWSFSFTCPICLICILIYPSDLSDLDHDLSCISVRSTWSRSSSIWSICPNYLIYHDLSDLSVRSIWSRPWSIHSIYVL